MKALIVTGGNPPRLNILTNYADKSDLVIGADKGCEALYNAKIKPNYILGDFDSAKQEVIKYFEEIGVEKYKYKKEKDYTDTRLAIDLAINKGAKEIYILGALGTRMDHMLSNIGLMRYGLKYSVRIEIVDEHNRIFLTDKNIKIKGVIGDIISFHAYSDVVENLSIKGAKYELNNYNLKLGEDRTTSNQFLANDIEITFNRGMLLVFYSID